MRTDCVLHLSPCHLTGELLREKNMLVRVLVGLPFAFAFGRSGSRASLAEVICRAVGQDSAGQLATATC